MSNLAKAVEWLDYAIDHLDHGGEVLNALQQARRLVRETTSEVKHNE